MQIVYFSFLLTTAWICHWKGMGNVVTKKADYSTFAFSQSLWISGGGLQEKNCRVIIKLPRAPENGSCAPSANVAFLSALVVIWRLPNMFSTLRISWIHGTFLTLQPPHCCLHVKFGCSFWVWIVKCFKSALFLIMATRRWYLWLQKDIYMHVGEKSSSDLTLNTSLLSLES